VAILRTVWKAKFNGSELCVVKEDQNAEVIFSISHDSGGVTERTTFRLLSAKAIDLARFLANITTVKKED